jgi:hypothetical protein
MTQIGTMEEEDISERGLFEKLENKDSYRVL